MEEQLTVSFRNTCNLIKRHVDKRLGNLTSIQIYILEYINNSPEDVYQKDIEKLLHIRRSTTTEILKVMEKNSLIERFSSCDDKRKRKITISPQGLLSLEKFKGIINEVEKHLFSGITPEERKVFFNVLKKIENNMEDDLC